MLRIHTWLKQERRLNDDGLAKLSFVGVRDTQYYTIDGVYGFVVCQSMQFMYLVTAELYFCTDLQISLVEMKMNKMDFTKDENIDRGS